MQGKTFPATEGDEVVCVSECIRALRKWTAEIKFSPETSLKTF